MSRGGGERVRWLSHDADILLEVEALSVERLFALAARALVGTMTDGRPQEAERRIVRLEGKDREDLLVAWLNEIVYLVGEGIFLPARFEIGKLSETILEAGMIGEVFDGRRHQLLREVKAATYHDLRVEGTDTGWRTRVLFDV